MSHLQSTTGPVSPYEAIPSITLLNDYPYHLPELLTQDERHNPIFRSSFSGHDDMVFLVGPEAHHYILVQQESKHKGAMYAD